MPELKTTFIPKEPLRKEKGEGGVRPTGLLLYGSVLLFLLSGVLYGGLFLYSALLDRSVESKTQDIARAQQAIEPLLVNRLTRVNARVESAKGLLDDHVVVSPIFALLEELTLETVSFSRFGYTLGADNEVELTLNGEAEGYTALAVQSDVLGNSPYIVDPLFSNLRLNERGNVAFQLNANITPALVRFSNNVNEEQIPSGTQPAAEESEEPVDEQDSEDEALETQS